MGEKRTTLFLKRQGETEENIAGILQGHMPGHLTLRGRQQAEALADGLREVKFDVLLSSDLKRTLDTAEILSTAVRLPVQPMSLLRERDWGSLTGESITAVRGLVSFPADVETVDQMFDRARRFLFWVTSAYGGQTVLAVTHGLFARCLLAADAGVAIRDIPHMGNAEVRHLILQQSPSESIGNQEENDMVTAD